MKKISIICPLPVLPVNHGAARRIVGFSKQLARMNYQVTILSIINESNFYFDVQKENLRIVQIPNNMIYRMPITNLIRADIIQFEFPKNLIILLLCKLFRKKIILDEHGVEVLFIKETNSSIGRRLTKKKILRTYFSELIALKLASAVFVCSSIDKIKLEKIYTKLNKKLKVIPNGVDPKYWTKKVSDSDGKTNSNIIFMGAYGHRPNIHSAKIIVEKIVPVVVKSNPDVTFTFIGQAPPKFLTNAGNQSKNIEVHGNVPDPRPYLNASTIALAPVYFGSGTRLKILEYLAAGKPVITTSKGMEGLDLIDGVNAIIRENPTSIAASINELIINKTLANKLAKNGQEYIINKFNWDTIVNEMSLTYHELLSD